MLPTELLAQSVACSAPTTQSYPEKKTCVIPITKCCVPLMSRYYNHQEPVLVTVLTGIGNETAFLGHFLGSI